MSRGHRLKLAPEYLPYKNMKFDTKESDFLFAHTLPTVTLSYRGPMEILCNHTDPAVEVLGAVYECNHVHACVGRLDLRKAFA